MLPSYQTLRVSILQEMHNTYKYMRKIFGAKSRKGQKAGRRSLRQEKYWRFLLLGAYCEGAMSGLRGTHWGEEKDIQNIGGDT